MKIKVLSVCGLVCFCLVINSGLQPAGDKEAQKILSTEEYETAVTAHGKIEATPFSGRLKGQEEEVPCLSDETVAKIKDKVDKEILNMEKLKQDAEKEFEAKVRPKVDFFLKEIKEEVVKKNGKPFDTQEELFKVMFPNFAKFRNRIQIRIKANMQAHQGAKVSLPDSQLYSKMLELYLEKLNKEMTSPLTKDEVSAVLDEYLKKTDAYVEKLNKELNPALTKEEISAIKDYAGIKNVLKVYTPIRAMATERMEEIMRKLGQSIMFPLISGRPEGQGVRDWINKNWP